MIIYSFKITVYRAKFLKRQIAYSAGHSGSFNPAAITNHEAHMINGNMDRKKEHNGASNILGRKSGVGKKICEIQPKALLTHCHAHSLSLSVKDTTSDSKVLSRGGSKQKYDILKTHYDRYATPISWKRPRN